MKEILYISGAGRSGSTLLEQTLGQFDNFIATGELRHIWERCFLENQLCSCGQPFDECLFWREVVSHMTTSEEDFNPQAILAARDKFRLIHMAPEKWTSFFVQRNPIFLRYITSISNLYRAIAEAGQGRIIIDSSKNPFYLLSLKLLHDFKIYVIHLVRDSRAVAYSWTKKKERPEFLNKSVYFKIYHPFASAIRWTFKKNFATEWINRKKEHYLLMRYEDFVENPISSIKKIFKLVDLDEDTHKVFISPHTYTTNRIEHTVSGNPIRFSNGEVRIQRDDQWKKNMKWFHKIGVTFLSFPYLLKYGYFHKQRNSMTTNKEE